MIHQLAALGIVRGQAFAPSRELRGILKSAPSLAREFLDERYGQLFDPPFYPGTHWAVPVPPSVIQGQATGYAPVDNYPVDERAVLFSIAYFSAKHLGAGQFYLLSVSDADGQPLDGSQTYRFTVPADPPVELYWSATIYDRHTHGLIRDLPWASRASITPTIATNPDGSTDIVIGPQPPAGGESNWISSGSTGPPPP